MNLSMTFWALKTFLAILHLWLFPDFSSQCSPYFLKRFTQSSADIPYPWAGLTARHTVKSLDNLLFSHQNKVNWVPNACCMEWNPLRQTSAIWLALYVFFFIRLSQMTRQSVTDTRTPVLKPIPLILIVVNGNSLLPKLIETCLLLWSNWAGL